jgi:hypothetical protein
MPLQRIRHNHAAEFKHASLAAQGHAGALRFALVVSTLFLGFSLDVSNTGWLPAEPLMAVVKKVANGSITVSMAP